MDTETLQHVRRFNRTVSRRIGALEQSYLARGRPLGEARVLFEIGAAGGIDLKALRDKLGLDSGYLSRLLRALETAGLIALSRSPDDGRGRHVALTPKGAAEWAAYDTLSDQLAGSLLVPLGKRERTRLVAAMQEVDLLLRSGGVIFAVEAAGSADARDCLARYFAELATRFEGGFDPARGNATISESEMTPPAGFLLLARSDGEAVGCAALKRLSADTAEIKRMWIAPALRGCGLASRMLREVEALAATSGFRRLRLDTNRTLAEAQALYRRHGYREIARYNDNPYADHWFEKTLGG